MRGDAVVRLMRVFTPPLSLFILSYAPLSALLRFSMNSPVIAITELTAAVFTSLPVRVTRYAGEMHPQIVQLPSNSYAKRCKRALRLARLPGGVEARVCYSTQVDSGGILVMSRAELRSQRKDSILYASKLHTVPRDRTSL